MAEAEGEFLEQFETEEQEALREMEFAICVGRFYPELAESLIAGATNGFQVGGVTIASTAVFDVPGAFELPLAAKLCADSGRFAGVACLGVVIRGETNHYDYVCAESARGIQQAQLDTGVPCAFGVITCDNMEQAKARTGGDKRDQGRNAALTVMRMALLDREIAGGLSEASETNGDGHA
jgi:6,7-dimethyl-8-ribityllumazine synthase